MKRREFITLLGGAAASWPLAARAQQPDRVFRIGFLGFGSASTWSNRVEALRGGLRDFGYVEGRNIVIEFRWTETIEQLPELASERSYECRSHFCAFIDRGRGSSTGD